MFKLLVYILKAEKLKKSNSELSTGVPREMIRLHTETLNCKPVIADRQKLYESRSEKTRSYLQSLAKRVKTDIAQQKRLPCGHDLKLATILDIDGDFSIGFVFLPVYYLSFHFYSSSTQLNI